MSTSALEMGVFFHFGELTTVESSRPFSLRLSETEWSSFGQMRLWRPHQAHMTLCILGDPGSTSRDDVFSGERHFWCESLLLGLKSPWALFLTKRVPEVVEIRPAYCPAKFFSGQSTSRSSRVILSPSYTKWFCSSMDLVAWPLQREDSREEFQNKDLTKKGRFLPC